MQSYKSALILPLLTALASAGDKKCRALVLSGGGSKGAWEAGVIWGLTHYGEPSDYYWDVHTGISAGSINTLGQVGFLPSETVEASEYISNVAAHLTNDMIYQPWVGHGATGIVRGCVTRISCMNSDPMLHYLTDTLCEFTQVKRRFTIGAGDVNTGENVKFTQDNVTFEELPMVGMSSSSIPSIF